MWPDRIAFAVVLVWGALCLTIAAVLFVNLGGVEPPERYLAFGLGLVMLYMGGSMLAGLIWPAKPEEPGEGRPIEVPPLEQVRGRTAYRDDSTFTRNVTFAIGAIFLAVSLSAAAEQPIVLVISAISVGVLAGAGVLTWRQIQYGRARLVLDAPARRGDTMHGTITTSGSGWAATGRNVHATVSLLAIRTFRRSRRSTSAVVARSAADIAVQRDGNRMTISFTTIIPIVDTSEGQFSWNVQLETRTPEHRATFVVDVA